MIIFYSTFNLIENLKMESQTKIIIIFALYLPKYLPLLEVFTSYSFELYYGRIPFIIPCRVGLMVMDFLNFYLEMT